MAAIVRIKRRRDEDPQELVLLSYKKLRPNTDRLERGDSDQKTIFRFAGTVSSKDAAVSKPVREAIRKEKLEREFKQHQLNAYGELRQQTRQDHRQSSKKSRYKVISSHRALNLDSLDETACESLHSGQESEKNYQLTNDAENNGDGSDKVKTELLHESSFTKKNTDKKKEQSGDKNVRNSQENGDTVSQNISEKTAGTVCSVDTNNDAKDKKIFCLLDVETEMPTYQSLINQSTSDQITCNSEPMTREIVSERGADENYVYDLYFVNNRDFDFRMLEHDLTLESFSEDRLHAGGMSDDEEFVYEDEDDENDENNWRNDYPDEDPGFIENYDDDDDDDFYGRGLHELHAFESGQDHQLAEWMSWRCNIEDTNELSSDEDEVEKYEAGPAGSANYYKYVMEMHNQHRLEDADTD